MGLHKMLKKGDFLAELVRMCEDDTLPLLVGEV
jgi:hypothetical protein